MAIASSTLAFDNHAQRDGSVYCTETHTDSVGVEHTVSYLWRAGMDENAIMASRSVQLGIQLAEQEAVRLVDEDVPFHLDHQTKGEFADRFRARWKDSSRIDCARMATWLLDHIDNGTFTDAQVRSAFGLTVNQYTTLKAKLSTYRDAHNAVLAARGE